MKAYFRKELLEQGETPPHAFEDGGSHAIDWSKSYECWQPEYLNETLSYNGEYNMVILVPFTHPHYFCNALVWVKSIDFDFVETPKNSIFIEWGIGDIQDICSTLSDEQAREVLRYLDRNHDANEGISWDIIAGAVRDLFPDQECDYEYGSMQ